MQTIDSYETMYFEQTKKNSATCKSCGGFKVQPENVWFDEKGFGYSTKLTKCPHCNKIIILKHIEDYNFNKLNTDRRLYYTK